MRFPLSRQASLSCAGQGTCRVQMLVFESLATATRNWVDDKCYEIIALFGARDLRWLVVVRSEFQRGRPKRRVLATTVSRRESLGQSLRARRVGEHSSMCTLLRLRQSVSVERRISIRFRQISSTVSMRPSAWAVGLAACWVMLVSLVTGLLLVRRRTAEGPPHPFTSAFVSGLLIGISVLVVLPEALDQLPEAGTDSSSC